MKNSRVLISKMAIIFFQIPTKILKYKVFFENSKVFFFFLSETLGELNFI